jgi:hypothetical protein
MERTKDTHEDFKLIATREKEEVIWVYLRFRNSCIPSIVVTYWNPASISCDASFVVVAPVQISMCD